MYFSDINSAKSHLELSVNCLKTQLWNHLKTHASVLTQLLDAAVGIWELTDKGDL